MFEAIQEPVLAMAASPWVLLVLFAGCVIDGFFPPVPSESLVIALTSLAISHEAPNLWWIGLVAAAGAFLGDNIAYAIGTKLPIHSFRIFRSRRGQKTLAWAERALAKRGAVFILAARYIPIGRVAVNMTAGAVGYPYRRFVVVAAIAAVMWSGYSIGLGASAGAALHANPLLGVGAGVVLGVVMGVLVDGVVRLVLRRRGIDPIEQMHEVVHQREESEDPQALEPRH
ncbi:DedA family protein [Ruania alba]|uniref:Membrane protein DedA, SNARE-associated domain n=1 Tax=Ruania alba TaxID=648782 RepID=A0A1H5C8G1_9MICO|nr:DedA family protein [Ruania alba]SED63072.1 membrane protein DedA, SNARE-associated domain [Ruania alba]